jgi:uncharacterized protein (DUF885 family)
MNRHPSGAISVVLAAVLLANTLLAADVADSTGVDTSASEMRTQIERFVTDSRSLERSYATPASEARNARLRSFLEESKRRIEALNFDSMSQDGKVDYILLDLQIQRELNGLDREAKETAENTAYLPFAPLIIALETSRREMEPVNPSQAAAKLASLKPQIEAAQKAAEAKIHDEKGADAIRLRRVAGNRALTEAQGLRTTLHTWFAFYDSYDPLFTWWAEEAYKTADASLDSYTKFLREKVAGLPAPREEGSSAAGPRRDGGEPDPEAQAAAVARAGSTDDIVGNPLGRDALMRDLALELIPYTPEELIAIANQEFAWCENEMKKASREMGFGDDWKKALEKIKTMYVEPGKQPQAILDLALEAQKFLKDHDLVTVPPLAAEIWRMEMMSPERQLITPFFTGGEVISVSYPTNSMTFEQKMMTMRGNNIPMSRATVFHELIPGHHLQIYMSERYKPYRQGISYTPFLVEGWALYWELLLWDMKFQKTPEDRVGALFWHMHRCARIIFSLSFHLGKMTPEECVNFLVDRVGHERENAIGEVRRSFGGLYSPLYQAAYLLGGMQIYALRHELVDSGKMTNRQFHDAVLRENAIPIELIRASLTHQKLKRHYTATWRFRGEVSVPAPAAN